MMLLACWLLGPMTNGGGKLFFFITSTSMADVPSCWEARGFMATRRIINMRIRSTLKENVACLLSPTAGIGNVEWNECLRREKRFSFFLGICCRNITAGKIYFSFSFLSFFPFEFLVDIISHSPLFQMICFADEENRGELPAVVLRDIIVAILSLSLLSSNSLLVIQTNLFEFSCQIFAQKVCARQPTNQNF